MQLRNSYILKFFALLLFSFELLAPSLISTECFNGQETDSTTFVSVIKPNLYSFLFLEECNEEEREGKDALPLSIAFFDFKSLSIFSDSRSSYATLHSNQNQFDTHPPLYQLHQTFRL